MDKFSTAPDFILDLIFHKLNEEDLHETLRVSKSWFWASIRRIKKLQITWKDTPQKRIRCNPLKSIAEFYNSHRPPNEKMDWCDLFKHLVLDELIVIRDTETTQYLVNNGCNTAELRIETFREEESPLTLASLRTFTRLQSFEFRNHRGIKWHPFIVECLNSSEVDFDRNNLCQIEAIKLNARGWNPGDPVLKSVTKLGVCKVAVDFLRTMLDHCPNLEELHCFWGAITRKWHQVLPANVRRIELHYFKVDDDVASVVNASTDAGRQLLPYLCQNWESVEKFRFDCYILKRCQALYEASPQQREEVFMCEFLDEEMNLASPLFQNREIHVRCYDWNASQLRIPPTKSVTFEFRVGRDFKFSPKAVCLEPGKVERFSLTLKNAEKITLDPFGPSSFEGFSHLTSLTLSCVNALSIKMALDQCPSVRKLKLDELKAFTIGSMSSGSSYANLSELVLETCEEPMQAVFQVFPRLSKFKHSERRNVDRCKAGDWLWRHLIEVDKKYGVSYGNSIENWYLVSDDLQASLNEAQKLLKQEILCGEPVCYLKGFKLIPRNATQKVIYIN